MTIVLLAITRMILLVVLSMSVMFLPLQQPLFTRWILRRKSWEMMISSRWMQSWTWRLYRRICCWSYWEILIFLGNLGQEWKVTGEEFLGNKSMYVCMYVRMYLMYVCMYTCVYIYYTCKYTDFYIYIYIHIYIYEIRQNKCRLL